MVNQKFSVFHRAILAFFVLIFLSGCGYKADPFYGDEPAKQQETQRINNI